MICFRNSSNMARIGAKLCQNAFRTILHVSSFDAEKKKSAKFSDHNFRFSLIWRGFGRSTAERTSKSASTSNFALDRLILRSVRPKNPEFGSNLGSPKIFTRLKVSVSLEELFPQPHVQVSRLHANLLEISTFHGCRHCSSERAEWPPKPSKAAEATVVAPVIKN